MQIRETRAVRGGRLLLLAAAVLAGGTLRAEIVEYWAPGVSETSGWYNTFQFRNGCWAGCSTDMFVWWQDRIREKYDTSAMTKSSFRNTIRIPISATAATTRGGRLNGH